MLRLSWTSARCQQVGKPLSQPGKVRIAVIMRSHAVGDDTADTQAAHTHLLWCHQVRTAYCACLAHKQDALTLTASCRPISLTHSLLRRHSHRRPAAYTGVQTRAEVCGCIDLEHPFNAQATAMLHVVITQRN